MLSEGPAAEGLQEVWRGRLPAGQPPLAVGRWLQRELSLSTSLIRRLKACGGLRVGGRVVRSVDPVHPGEEVVLSLPVALPPHLAPERMDLSIVHEDADVVVVDKPAGLVVHPTRGTYAGTLGNGLAHHWAQRGERCGLHPVHRLDRDTSGLVVLAKHSLAHQRLDGQLKSRTLQRRYLALVAGHLAPPTGTVSLPIGLPEANARARAVMAGGQPAVTHYAVQAVGWLPDGRAVSVVQLGLETGRTHQIRVHLAALGHALLGDTLYGGDSACGLARQALHACDLAFDHPRTGDRVAFASPLPADLGDLAARLLPGGASR